MPRPAENWPSEHQPTRGGFEDAPPGTSHLMRGSLGKLIERSTSTPPLSSSYKGRYVRKSEGYVNRSSEYGGLSLVGNDFLKQLTRHHDDEGLNDGYSCALKSHGSGQDLTLLGSSSAKPPINTFYLPSEFVPQNSSTQAKESIFPERAYRDDSIHGISCHVGKRLVRSQSAACSSSQERFNQSESSTMSVPDLHRPNIGLPPGLNTLGVSVSVGSLSSVSSTGLAEPGRDHVAFRPEAKNQMDLIQEEFATDAINQLSLENPTTLPSTRDGVNIQHQYIHQARPSLFDVVDSTTHTRFRHEEQVVQQSSLRSLQHDKFPSQTYSHYSSPMFTHESSMGSLDNTTDSSESQQTNFVYVPSIVQVNDQSMTMRVSNQSLNQQHQPSLADQQIHFQSTYYDSGKQHIVQQPRSQSKTEVIHQHDQTRYMKVLVSPQQRHQSISNYATIQYHQHSLPSPQQQPQRLSPAQQQAVTHLLHQPIPQDVSALDSGGQQHISLIPIQNCGVHQQQVTAYWQGDQLQHAHHPSREGIITPSTVSNRRADANLIDTNSTKSAASLHAPHVMNHGIRNRSHGTQQEVAQPLLHTIQASSPICNINIAGRGRDKGSAASLGKGRRGVAGSGSRRSSDPKQPTCSTRLEEFKAAKNRDWTMHQAAGYIVEFCQDQNGSRFIQQRLEMGDASEQLVVAKEVIPAIRRLRNDVFGNYVVQKLLDYGSTQVKADICDTLEGEMLQLSLQMYGCRVVQKAMEALEQQDVSRLLVEFHHNVLSCIHDQNGNHVIQKCIEVMSKRAKKKMANGALESSSRLTNQLNFIINDVLVNTATLSCHPYGCRVLQRILEHCDDARKEHVLDEIQKCHKKLLDDQYGNYVIQHVLQFGREIDRDSILSIVVESGLLGLSRQKFASNVVEKLLKYGNDRHRCVIVREMLKEPPMLVHTAISSTSVGQGAVVIHMVRDAYANYVVQTALDVVPQSEEKILLLQELGKHSEELRQYTFAKHIVVKLNNLINT